MIWVGVGQAMDMRDKHIWGHFILSSFSFKFGTFFLLFTSQFTWRYIKTDRSGKGRKRGFSFFSLVCECIWGWLVRLRLLGYLIYMVWGLFLSSFPFSFPICFSF